MKSALRYLLLLAGLVLFAWFIHRSGLDSIASAFAKLGWMAPVVLVPFLTVYTMDTLGWWLAFGNNRPKHLGFLEVMRIRWAGEGVNNVIPSAYIGGEALKVYLLGKRGVAASTGTASVVVGKTVQTLAQLLFLVAGSAAFLQLPGLHPSVKHGLVVVVGAGSGVVLLLFALQHFGLFALLARVAGWMRIKRLTILTHAEKLLQIDQMILSFYRKAPRHFAGSVAAYGSGWALETLELLLIGHLLEQPLLWNQALAVAAFVGIAKALGLAVPGALGVQESGIVFLARAAGLPESFGVAYALIRRAREVIYAAIGWGFLYAEEVSWKAARQISRTAE